MGSDNDLAWNRRRAIFWTDDSSVHWCIYASLSLNELRILTHWGRVMHICVSKSTIIGSDNGLSPGRRQAIIWTNAGILLIGPLGTKFSEISIGIQIFSFTKMRLKMLSAKWHPFCPGLNVLKNYHYIQILNWHWASILWDFICSKLLSKHLTSDLIYSQVPL